MKVSEIMSQPICQVDPETSLAEATTLMGEHGVGSALVMQAERLVGILTDRDIVRAMSGAHDAPLRPVIEWMTRGPTTIPPDTDVREALRTMVDGGFRHLPVLEEEKLVGMISIRDVARALSD